MFESWDFWSFIAGLVSGITITFVSIRIFKNIVASGGGSVVDQSKARAGGDIIGGNKN